jgi:ABC-type phosphate/phosphonate transport system permease subunit
MNPDDKKCPFCAEIVKKEAIKCKHCGSNIAKVPPILSQPPKSRRNKYTLMVIFIAATLILASTNPDEKDFNEQVIKNLQGSQKLNQDDTIGKLAIGVTSYAINLMTERKNYYIFSVFEIDTSLLKIINPNTQRMRYLGVLGQIIPLTPID